MSLDSNKSKKMIEEVLAIAHEAGNRIREVYEDDYSIAFKSDDTPVTTADLEANKIIVAALEGLSQTFPIISEEEAHIPYAERHSWSRYWLVDPLDGTREFIRRNGEFSVNIALIENGQPILGVITAPVLGLAYFAARGQGAWKQVGDNSPESIHVRPVPKDDTELTLARSRCPHTSERLQVFLDNLGTHNEVPMGSSLKSCLVAEGAADLYVRLGPTSEWDTAAAQCIVEEAGGKITDTKLQELKYNTQESLLNPHFMVFGDKSHNWCDYLMQDSA